MRLCFVQNSIVMQHTAVANVSCVINPDEKTAILSTITTLKSSLSNMIEPDFGLLDHLRSLQVLTPRDLADVRSGRTVFRRNDALLDLITSEEISNKFLTALQRTGQEHVVNFVRHKGGQLNVASDIHPLASEFRTKQYRINMIFWGPREVDTFEVRGELYYGVGDCIVIRLPTLMSS